MTFPRFNLLVLCLAGWLTQQQNDIIDFLMEENRTLQDLLGKQRLRLNDRQRRRLAAKAKPIPRKVLGRGISHLPMLPVLDTGQPRVRT